MLLRKCDTYIGMLLLPTFVLGKFVRPFAIIFLVDSSMTAVVMPVQQPVVCQEEGVFLGN